MNPELGVFPYERLGKRQGRLLGQFVDGTAESVPLACQDWANTKAAYRFFANERVTEEDILAGHFGGILKVQQQVGSWEVCFPR